MLNLYREGIKVDVSAQNLSDGEKASIIYHDLFEYPLSFSDLIKWQVGSGLGNINVEKSVSRRGGYYFLDGKAGFVYKRLLHKRISAKKTLIAKKYANIIGLIPSVKMVAITGSLAMNNASEDSDIDLLIVSKRNTLWTTRAVSYILLWMFGAKTRKPNDRNQKDKLCLNMWMDESDLNWKVEDRNIYTAHEIAQVAPLVNKDNTYENFLSVNKWILKYWPNAVKIKRLENSVERRVRKLNSKRYTLISDYVEKLAYKLQYQHMKSKMSREVVTKSRALFHPQDWGGVVIKRLTT